MISSQIISRRKAGLRGDQGTGGDSGAIGPQGTNLQGYPGIVGEPGPTCACYLAYDLEDVSATGASQNDYLSYKQTSQNFILQQQQPNTIPFEQINFSQIPTYPDLIQARNALGFYRLYSIDRTKIRLTQPEIFTSRWQQTPSNNVLTLPVGGTYTVSVDWDDGLGFREPTSSPPTNTYSSATTIRRVKMAIFSGSPTYSMQNNPSPTRTMTLTAIDRWGKIKLSGNGRWFDTQTEFTAINATDAPILTGATSFAYAFRNCPLATFNQTGMDLWEIPSGLDMSSSFTLSRLPNTVQFKPNWFNNPGSCVEMFGNNYDPNPYFNATFHPDIVIPETCSIEVLFYRCSAFNQVPPNLSTTPGRTSFFGVFGFCDIFNQPLPSSWTTATTTQNITRYDQMFRNCYAFNQNLSSTFVSSSAIFLSFMFFMATSFNNGGSNSISDWNTSNAVNLDNMLAFTQINYNLLGTGKWSLTKAENLSNMFSTAPNFNNGGVDIQRNFGTTDRFIDLSYMFTSCTSLTDVAFNGTTILPSGSGTVINMEGTYSGCTHPSLTGSNITSDFINNRVTNLGGTFSGCDYFVGSPEMVSWDVSNVTTFHASYIEGMLHGTLFDYPVMGETAWGGLMSSVRNTTLMFATSTPFTNGGEPIYWHPTYGTFGSPLIASGMFNGAISTNTIDITYGTGETGSVWMRLPSNARGLGFASVNADFTGCNLERIRATDWQMTWSSGGTSQTNFENSVIYWDSTIGNREAQGVLTTPFLWGSLSAPAQAAIISLISYGWVIIPHP